MKLWIFGSGVSDLVSNSIRGKLAEFIVAKALGVDTNMARDEWQSYDLLTSVRLIESLTLH